MATDPLFLAQLAANGLSVGMGYALAAIGLALIFGILGQVNFAHGELYMLGAFLLLWGMRQLGLPYAAAAVLVIGMMAVVGVAIAQGIIADHTGRIEVASRLGIGTTFRVILPVGVAPAQAAAE